MPNERAVEPSPCLPIVCTYVITLTYIQYIGTIQCNIYNIKDTNHTHTRHKVLGVHVPVFTKITYLEQQTYNIMS